MAGSKVCCVIGAGDATGSAVARRVAAEGCTVCVARRTKAALEPLTDSIIPRGGKAALRALAQSMARECGPQGLHVAHVVIDGLIDTAFTRDNFAQHVAAVGTAGILNPDHIAQAYWWLHCQPRDAWTFDRQSRSGSRDVSASTGSSAVAPRPRRGCPRQVTQGLLGNHRTMLLNEVAAFGNEHGRRTAADALALLLHARRREHGVLRAHRHH